MYIQNYKYIPIKSYITHTLILKALLNPLAKNPPNGPITELNMAIEREWSKNGYMLTVLG